MSVELKRWLINVRVFTAVFAGSAFAGAIIICWAAVTYDVGMYHVGLWLGWGGVIVLVLGCPVVFWTSREPRTTDRED